MLCLECKLKLHYSDRSYKELMAKCNVLGRGEARYSKKLEKAKEKITKLKVCTDELVNANLVSSNF